jgi:hypothetical protein
MPAAPIRKINRRFSFVGLSLVLAFVVSGCPSSNEVKALDDEKGASAAGNQGLLTAYVLLENTLSQESKLGALAFLKKITFRRPVPEIDEIMDRLSDISQERLDQLEELRQLAPDVSALPTFTDPIGEAITSSATESGMDEMLDLDGSFGVRFVLLQAQATRMISAISLAAAEIETNERRKKWLTDLSKEFESIRDELVVIVDKYVLQKGAAQLPD